MAEIKFYGNLNGAVATDDADYIDHSQSGIGFFGGGFGLSVPVDSYQDNTFITNSDGTAEGLKLMNTKYDSVSGVKHNTANAVDNNTIPNYYAPLNIRFTHEEAVRVKNCQLRIFDRSDITKHASGVTTEVYEIRHPEGVPAGDDKALHWRPSQDHSWTTFVYDGVTNEVSALSLTESPGMSGLNGDDTDEANANLNTIGLPYTFDEAGHQSIRHDWYVALSASPDEIGSKTDFGLYFTVEYL